MNNQIFKKRLFFTSVPKAGKNVIQSFLFKLGFSRFDLKKNLTRELAVQSTYLKYFPNLDKRATYALPAVTIQERLKLQVTLEQFLEELYEMPERSFVHHHFAFDEELLAKLGKQDIPIVFLYRDPRAILLSMANYFLSQRKPKHLIHKLDGLSIEDMMILLLKGDEEIIPFAQYMESFTGWLNVDGVLVLRFEDVIGPKGGGTLEEQQLFFISLANHIGLVGSNDQIEVALTDAFNNKAGTFFKGKIDTWKEYFTMCVKEAFKKETSDLLTKWGYGEDILNNEDNKIN